MSITVQSMKPVTAVLDCWSETERSATMHNSYHTCNDCLTLYVLLLEPRATRTTAGLSYECIVWHGSPRFARSLQQIQCTLVDTKRKAHSLHLPSIDPGGLTVLRPAYADVSRGNVLKGCAQKATSLK